MFKKSVEITLTNGEKVVFTKSIIGVKVSEIEDYINKQLAYYAEKGLYVRKIRVL